MVTVCSSFLGMLAGVLFAAGWAFLAGLVAAISQALDGVDGQLARLTDRESKAGAFLDSVLDRYADGAIVFGLTIYSLQAGIPVSSSPWLVLAVGAAALIGSGLISYTTARADSLGLDTGPPTLASKGTRTTVSALSGLASPLWPILPLVALCYLAVHSNLVTIYRIFRISREK